jgi:hypothetical protein
MILELDDHDALRLLALARKELHQAYHPWRSYWEHLSEYLQQSIELAAMDPLQTEQTGELDVDELRLT